jgi:aryl-alcohol dehydrogenase-like predicted oxidoreductase
VKQRALGTIQVTAIGCGDVSVEVAAARGVDVRDVEHAVHHALELGITLLDVAAEDAAERLCGEAVRTLRLRDQAVVATRVPEVAPRPGVPQRDLLLERLPVAYVQQRVEASLRTTRLEVLPLVLVPVRAAWRDSPAWPELAGTCARLVREGKVQQWGAIADEALGEPWLIAQQLVYSVCEHAADALVEAAAPVVLARRPLAGGGLAGSLGPGALLAPRDDRRALSPAQLEQLAVGMGHTAPLVEREPAAARSCDAARAALERGVRPPHVEAITAAELALRFVIDRGAIALPRLHRRDHVAEAIAAASAPPLSPELRDRLVALYT